MGQAGPEAVYDLDDLVERLNAIPERARGKPRWNRWSVRRLLAAGQVPLIQRGPRCKVYVLLSALRDSFPEFVDSLAFAEAVEEERGAA